MNREKLAQQIIDSCIEMNALGLNQGTSGNISVRYQQGMLITPSGVAYKELTPNDIVYINELGEYPSNQVPSSEWQLHHACYNTRPQLNAVVHNHAVNATAIAILNRPIPAIHYMVAVTGSDHVPCIPYSIFGSEQLAQSVGAGIKESKAILMQHHGMIAMEVNLAKALWLAAEIEVLSSLYLKVLSVQNSVPVLDQQQMQDVLDKFKTYGLKSE